MVKITYIIIGILVLGLVTAGTLQISKDIYISSSDKQILESIGITEFYVSDLVCDDYYCKTKLISGQLNKEIIIKKYRRVCFPYFIYEQNINSETCYMVELNSAELNQRLENAIKEELKRITSATTTRTQYENVIDGGNVQIK